MRGERALRKLEEFTGVVLLQRGKKGVRPTPAGERLLAYARDMLCLSDRAFEDMRGATLMGELRLAITDYFRPGAIVEMLKRLRARHPELLLNVTVRKSLQIDEEAGSGEFDIGLSMRILDGRGLPRAFPSGASRCTGLQLPGAGRKITIKPGCRCWAFRAAAARPVPPLPHVELSLLPPRLGEPALVGEVRQMLAAYFA